MYNRANRNISDPSTQLSLLLAFREHMRCKVVCTLRLKKIIRIMEKLLNFPQFISHSSPVLTPSLTTQLWMSEARLQP